MDDREVREYLENVMRGKVAVLGLERNIVQRLQQVNLESLQMEKEISSLTSAREQATRRLHELNGLREGCVQILVEAENARRASREEGKAAPKNEPGIPENKVHDLDDVERQVLSKLVGMDVDRAELHAVPQGGNAHGHAGR